MNRVLYRVTVASWKNVQKASHAPFLLRAFTVPMGLGEHGFGSLWSCQRILGVVPATLRVQMAVMRMQRGVRIAMGEGRY